MSIGRGDLLRTAEISAIIDILHGKRGMSMHYVHTKGILSPQNGMNLYRGCSHGCIYCDSRSHCYGMNHPFEDIEVKENALQKLEEALKRKRKKCMIGTGSMSDPYLPLEAELCHTRKALELILRYGFGAALLTKSTLVLRDLDLLERINRQSKCVVQMTLTTYDEDLCRILEPNVSTTGQRASALQTLREAGIPTVVWLSPILPYINDTEKNLDGILSLCAGAGVTGVICFGMGLTLRDGNREYFYSQLDRHFPGLKDWYIRDFGDQYVVNSPHQDRLMRRFHEICERYGILHDNSRIFQYLRTYEERHSGTQLCLWDTP